MTRFHRTVLLGLASLAWAAPASAQDGLRAAQDEIAGVLAEIEGNLIEKEAIDMNFTVWESKHNAFMPRLDDLNRRYDEANAYCQGTFDEPEYSRRLAYCNSTFSQLDALKAQMLPEADALDREIALLQERDTRRQAAGTDLGLRLATGVEHLVAACIDLPVESQALCQLLPAPGPRTRDLVAEINAGLLGS